MCLLYIKHKQLYISTMLICQVVNHKGGTMVDVIDLIEQGKVKRFFRARNKYCFEGAVSHITQHASGKEPLFLEESDYVYMLHLIKEISNEFQFKILSFTLMLNHLHLLIKFLESNMSNAMKELFRIYAVYFNKKYARKGHAFCGAYRSALCFDDNYLLAASLYIHFNPVKAGLVANPVDYRWSSCALFLNSVEKDTFIDYKFILSLLDNDISKAIEKYKNLLYRLDVVYINDVFEQPKALEIIVEMLKTVEGRRINGSILLSNEELDKKIQELKEKGNLRGPYEKEARKFLIEQLISRGSNVLDIAKKLNLSRQSVYSYLNCSQTT
ncbi:MAG TPA: hypothetical protein DCY56_03700 [Candidatus Omnitrophica bacterium]|nr:hypothetical protein [Candidatus Omnitrophota bacterium]